MQELLEYIIKDKPDLLLEYNFKKAVGQGLLAASLLTSTPEISNAKEPVKIEHQQEDRIIVAKVIAGEAAGEGYNGMYAVACVIQNRSKGDPISVVKAPHQFSAYNDKALMDRNYSKVKETADQLANQIGNLKDITGGATHYVTNKYYRLHKNKGWLSRLIVTKIIGNHTFLK